MAENEEQKRVQEPLKKQIYEAEEGQPEWFDVKRVMISAANYDAYMQLQEAVGIAILQGKISKDDILCSYYDDAVAYNGIHAYPIPDDALGLLFPPKTDDRKYTHGFFPHQFQSDVYPGVPDD